MTSVAFMSIEPHSFTIVGRTVKDKHLKKNNLCHEALAELWGSNGRKWYFVGSFFIHVNEKGLIMRVSSELQFLQLIIWETRSSL